MNEKIDSAIEALTDKAKNEKIPSEAMKFAQAVLNLAHAKATLAAIQ